MIIRLEVGWGQDNISIKCEYFKCESKVMGYRGPKTTLWCHYMETFSLSRALCEGNPLFTGGSPHKGPVMRNFDIFFDACQNKWLNKQWSCWWFGTPCSWCDITVMWWGLLMKVLVDMIWFFSIFAQTELVVASHMITSRVLSLTYWGQDTIAAIFSDILKLIFL